jgi:hypothetical protein
MGTIVLAVLILGIGSILIVAGLTFAVNGSLCSRLVDLTQGPTARLMIDKGYQRSIDAQRHRAALRWLYPLVLVGAGVMLSAGALVGLLD